jgi:DNA-binding GntR family transcriptional regulator
MGFMPGKPKYVLIYEWLSHQIETKKYRPGDKLPSEHELATMFQVHRMTIRQAIDKLIGDHLLARKRRAGTFLLSDKSPVLIRSLETISTYYEDIREAGLDPSYRTLDAKVIPGTEPYISHLGLRAGDPVFSIYRLMLASNVPLVLERCYLPGDLFPGLLERNLDTVLYDLMKRDYHIVPHFAQQEIGAVLPNLAERKLLKIKETCPCIQVHSIAYDQTGRPIEFALGLHRGDKYRFKCSIGKVAMYDRDER